MKSTILALGILLGFSSLTYSQDLLKEGIRKLSDRKKSIFHDRGIFHSDSNPKMQKLVNIRNSFVSARGYERIVIDFTGMKPPRIYGHISKTGKKVFIDIFNASMTPTIESIKTIKFLREVKFFDIEQDHISLELSFNRAVSFDIFYLENPARLVLDVKK